MMMTMLMTISLQALLPDPTKFPEGIKPLRDWLHERNLTLGLYTSDAERSCKKTTGSLYHESAYELEEGGRE